MADINAIRKILYDAWGLLYLYNDEGYDNVSSVKKCLIEIIKKEDNRGDDNDDIIEDILIKVYVKDNKNIICNGIKRVLQRLYHLNQETSYSRMYLCNTDSTISSTTHPGLGDVYRYIDTNDYIIIASQYSKHSLLSITRFQFLTQFLTPTLGRYNPLGSKDMRIRFLIFQLLQVLSYLHAKGVIANISNPAKIMIDDAMWLYIPISNSNSCIVSEVLKAKESITQNNNNDNDNDKEYGPIIEDDGIYNTNTNTNTIDEKDLDNVINDLYTPITRHVDYYCPITTQWMSRKISNFEYLMAINYAAGRTMLDPLYHPIFPWVTDFTSDCLVHSSDDLESENVFRDLSRTKFRLSKGDAQLETTFKHSDPPHHVPESLSELTYYIYMARRTPLQVLRRVVRDVFVPEHYPHSIARMYDWTPDECIPEFFIDLNVFESLHKDLGLPDLELPSFAPTPAEFITFHRTVLESDEVSSQLHLWINLTFGHLLIGDEAVKNLNVPLKQTLASSSQLGDFTSSTKHPGFCILFHEPHPRRQVNQKTFSRKNYFHMPQDKLNIGFGDGKSNFFSNELGAFLQLDRKETRDRLRSASNGSPSSEQSQRLSDRETSILENETSFETEASPIKTYLAEMSDTKFSIKYQHLLEPYYGRGMSNQHFVAEINEEHVNDRDNKLNCWDEEFYNMYLSHLHYSKQLSEGEPLSVASSLSSLQSDDMFALGCIIAEMLTGEPLMSPDIARRNMNDESGRSSLLYTYQKTSSVPLVFRRLIAILVQPVRNARPTPTEILQSCSLSDTDTWLDKQFGIQESGGSESMYIPFSGEGDAPDSSTTCQNKRTDFLHSFCGSIFPSYFKQVYELVGNIKLCKNGLKRIRILRNNIDVITQLPLEGISLALPHLLNIISDSKPFRSKNVIRKCSGGDHDDFNDTGESDNEDDNELSRSNVILDYPIIIDVLGSRLGLEESEALMAPRILKFLQKIMSTSMLEKLLTSKLWQIIIIRTGVPCFLRNFLPLILTYLVSGNLFQLTKSSGIDSDMSPLWAVLGKTEMSEWLHNCSMDDINNVQKAAVQAIVRLCDPEMLGPGLCARYIVPALICLVGIPNLAVTGYSNNRLTDVNDLDTYAVDEFIMSEGSYKPEMMFATRAVALVCCKLGEVVTSEVVLQKIFVCIIPQILDTSANSIQYLASLMEITFLLSGILPSLSPEIVQRAYLQVGSSGTSIQKLLLSVPLAPILSVHDDGNIIESSSMSLQYYIIVQRRYWLLLEICRLLVSVAMMVGPAATINCILPSVDEFFDLFIEMYGRIPINSITMIKALELGAELYTPLNQLTGPEAFSTAVSSVNPRLEMWLASIGGGGERTSPPLPSSILPETESNFALNREQSETEKPAGTLRAWVMNKAKGIVSSTPMPTKAIPGTDNNNITTNKNKSSTTNDPKTNSKFTPFTSALDRSRLLRTGAQSIIKSATEGMELQEFDNSIVMPTPQNLMQVLNETANDTQEHHDDPDDLLSRGFNIDGASPDITIDTIDPHDIDNSNHSNGNSNDLKVNQKTRTRSSSLLVEDDKKNMTTNIAATTTNTIKNNDKALTYRNIYGNDNKGHDNYPSSFYKRLIYSKHAEQISNINRITKKKGGGGLLKGVTSNKVVDSDQANDDDISREAAESEMTWLLSGMGRWNIKMEVEANRSYEQTNSSIIESKKALKIRDLYMPAAMISTTSPRINVDAASEANEIFSLDLSNKWQHKVDDGYPIASMIVNAIESLLVTSSKNGVKIWSLNAYPLRQVSSYYMHSLAPFCMGFMKSGSVIASCDGNVNIWDIEKKDTLAFLNAPDKPFSHMHVVSSKSGINCGLGIGGDDQIVTCSGSTLSYYDFRSISPRSLKGIAEWTLPLLPGVSSHFSLSNQEAPTLTCALTDDLYTFAGSSWGTVYVVDKRMGRILSSWQCSDHNQGAVVKIEKVNSSTILCVQERAVTVWEYRRQLHDVNNQSVENIPRKVLMLKNMPDSGINVTNNTSLLCSFDQPKDRAARNSITVPQNIFDDSTNNALSVFYCVNSNKIYTAKLPRFDHLQRDVGLNLVSMNNKDNGVSADADENKLTKNNFTDINNVKIPKNKLTATSMAIMPMRRLLVLGTEDGSVRVIN